MSITIDNKTNTLETTDNKPIIISKNGCVKIGTGINLDENDSSYEGCLRYNTSLKCYQYHDGSQWVSMLSEEISVPDENYIWSYIF